MQTLLDEIATATGKDRVALRLALLPADARERAVLSLAAEKAGWSQPVAAGRYRGVAVHQSFGSFVATLAEVSKTADGGIQVERCVVASDCGTVINPDIVRAQIEGGTGFGLSAMLGERIALENSAPTASNYDAYRVLRIPQGAGDATQGHDDDDRDARREAPQGDRRAPRHAEMNRRNAIRPHAASA